MSRSTRVLGALGVGYAGQALMLVVGLWLTPFLLHRLGQQDYGLWLIALQMTAYLALLDLGVVALLPRETAYAVGRAGGERSPHDLPLIVGRATRLVLWQLPCVALVAGAVLVAMPAEWRGLQGPFAVIAVTFVLLFPLRVLSAVLQGLQELAYLGMVSLGTWVGGTAVTVALVLAGVGLYAVAAGWAAAQVAAAVFWWQRLRRHHPAVLPRGLPPLTRADARAWLGSSVWVSVAQVAQVLLAGTDLVIIGKVLGPAAVVPYAVTAKLVSVLANQPQMVMQAAMPALSELRASARSRAQLLRTTTALTQMMLLMSGGICVVVLLVNGAFVSWWVSPRQYAGPAVTACLLAGMLLRHWNTTAVYTIFCLGYERRIAVTTLIDGIVTVGAAVLLVRVLGPVGAVLGSVAGVCLVSLPANFAALIAGTGSSVAGVLVPLAPWFARFAGLAAGAAVLARAWPAAAPIPIAVAGVLAVAVYAAVMLPVALRAPLGTYLRPHLTAAQRRFSRTLADARRV